MLPSHRQHHDGVAEKKGVDIWLKMEISSIKDTLLEHYTDRLTSEACVVSYMKLQPQDETGGITLS